MGLDGKYAYLKDLPSHLKNKALTLLIANEEVHLGRVRSKEEWYATLLAEQELLTLGAQLATCLAELAQGDTKV